jgi:hypothetical protein
MQFFASQNGKLLGCPGLTFNHKAHKEIQHKGHKAFSGVSLCVLCENLCVLCGFQYFKHFRN